VKTRDFIIKTYGPNALFDVTKEIEMFIKDIEASTGIIVVNVMGSTGALVLLNPAAIEKVKSEELWNLVPVNANWKHEGNAYAHLRSTVLRTSLTIPVREGKLTLGNNRVFFIENQCSMARERHFYLTYIGK